MKTKRGGFMIGIGAAVGIMLAAAGPAAADFVAATGGSSTNDYTTNGVTYRAHVFTNTGSSTFTVTTGGVVQVLVVAGGGAGGGYVGGGGGAGGVKAATLTITPGTTNIIVGAGGTTANGGNSTFGSVTATGGGQGAKGGGDGRPLRTALAGGSGGGGGSYTLGTIHGNGTGTEGSNGGDSAGASGNYGSGGGGGYSAVGGYGSNNGGAGGDGYTSAISGVSTQYAGGGGGAVGGTGNAGTGGTGGGGNGSIHNANGTTKTAGTAGAANTGGGGGGGGTLTVGDAQFPGGSGIVIVRYVTAATVPLVYTLEATDLTANSATLNGTLGYLPGGQAEVRVYWGTNDAGPTAAGWMHTNVLASNVGTAPTSYTYSATSLSTNYSYSYRYYATNTTGSGEYWGDVQPAAADRPAAEKELLELTGGKRLKVVWLQENGLKYYDSKAGVIKDLPIRGSPQLSLDGRRVFVTTGKPPHERVVVVCDLETMKVKELGKKGPGNYLLAVWMDPKSGKEWVYVNDNGDKNEDYMTPAGKVYRFPVDKPADRELFWDRTPSHTWLMFSADGTKACFEPTWQNIGQLSIAYGPDGKIDQDKSDFKTYGAGCYPGFAPDNSYRLFRLDGPHRSITMHDAGGGNARQITTAVMPGVKEMNNGQTWLTRWSTHPRFMTCMAPQSDPRARIWLLRFDEGFTRIEGAVPVTNERDPMCWNSHAWIDSGEEKAEKPGKPAKKSVNSGDR